MIVFNAKLIITGKSEVLAYFIFASSRTKHNLPIAFGIHKYTIKDKRWKRKYLNRLPESLASQKDPHRCQEDEIHCNNKKICELALKSFFYLKSGKQP